MPDNRIRLKQLYTPELSGYVVSVSSGEAGPIGPIGPTGLSGVSIIGGTGAAGPAGADGAAGPAGADGGEGAGSLPSGYDGMLQYNNSEQWAGTPQIFYDDTGHRIGLNTVHPSGKISFGTYTNSDNTVPHLMLYDDSTSVYRYGINYHGGLIKQFIATGASSLGHSFGTVTSKNEFTEHVRITKDGKMGIQCSPAEILDVNSGSLKIRAGDLKITGRVGVNVDPTDWALDVRGNVKIKAGGGASGYLGVGGVPTKPLHVFGDGFIDGGNLSIGKTGIIVSQKVGGAPAYIYVDENDDLIIRKSDKPDGFFVADDGGNIGIKHASPAYDLDVLGPLGIRTSHNSYGSKAVLNSDGADLRLYNQAGSAKVKITAGGHSYIKGGGLGIGITPSTIDGYELDVVGSGRFSKSISVNSTGYFKETVSFSSNFINTITIGAAPGAPTACVLDATEGEVRLKSSTPTTATPCVAGTITWDDGNIYICTDTDVWKYATLSQMA